MSSDPVAQQQQKIKEFLSLVPLTFELAGLAKASPGSFFNDGQMEARATAIKNAYKVARQILVDISK